MINSKKNKRVVLSVTNEIFGDQRVDKVCHTLLDLGFEVMVVGRRHNNSPSLADKPYQSKRFRLLFHKGPLFYAEFNLRLFFYLLFVRCDILTANDLDTLLPNLLVSRLRHKQIVYDSHEYFCGVLEVIERPKVHKCWLAIERYCFPKLQHITTVSQSIANQYEKEYGKKVQVVRNIPRAKTFPVTETRESLGLPADKKIAILQGTGLHRDRGVEEIVEAIPFVDNVLLVIVGSGAVIPLVQTRVKELQIEDKVRFVPRVAPEKLFNYTRLADIRISLDKDASPNHHFSLPNKIFEYIQAGVPILSTDLPERKRIIEKYKVGKIVQDLSPKALASAIQEMLGNEEQYLQWKANCVKAAQDLCWENEEKVLQKIYLSL
ncbi:MAG: glycosyltransferase [Bacteroidales bacterium]|nr:glycosyltransferase [Bacteroidales bacterium]